MLIRTTTDPTYELLNGLWVPTRPLRIARHPKGRRVRAFRVVDEPKFPVLRALRGGTLTAFGPTYLPRPIIQTGLPAFASKLFDGGTDQLAFILTVPKTGTLDRFEFRTGAVTTWPTNGIRCSFQDIDTATGNPDGTQDQYRDIVTALSANAWVDSEYPGAGTLEVGGADGGGKRAVTRGQKLACVIELVNTGDTTSFNVSSISTVAARAELNGYLPHMRHNASGAYAQQGSDISIVALKYNDGTFGYVNAFPFSAINTHSLTAAGNPDEVALALTTPVVPLRIGGAWMLLNGSATGRAFDVVLYNNVTQKAQFQIVDTDELVSASAASLCAFLFDADYDVATSETWRLAHKAGAAATASYSFDVAAAALLDSMEGGQDISYSERQNGTDPWSPIATRRLFAGFLFTAFDDGAGGGARLRTLMGVGL